MANQARSSTTHSPPLRAMDGYQQQRELSRTLLAHLVPYRGFEPQGSAFGVPGDIEADNANDLFEELQSKLTLPFAFKNATILPDGKTQRRHPYPYTTTHGVMKIVAATLHSPLQTIGSKKLDGISLLLESDSDPLKQRCDDFKICDPFGTDLVNEGSKWMQQMFFLGRVR